MNTILGLSSVLISVAALTAACRMHGYSSGKADGFKEGREKGFAEGFAEGKNSEARWWIDLEYKAECGNYPLRTSMQKCATCGRH